jgi:hypothetical protein
MRRTVNDGYPVFATHQTSLEIRLYGRKDTKANSDKDRGDEIVAADVLFHSALHNTARDVHLESKNFFLRILKMLLASLSSK